MYSQLLLRPLGMLKSVNTEASEFTTVLGRLFPPVLVFTPLVNSLPWSLGWSCDLCHPVGKTSHRPSLEKAWKLLPLRSWGP